MTGSESGPPGRLRPTGGDSGEKALDQLGKDSKEADQRRQA